MLLETGCFSCSSDCSACWVISASELYNDVDMTLSHVKHKLTLLYCMYWISADGGCYSLWVNSYLTLWAGELYDETDDTDVSFGGGVVKWGGPALVPHAQVTRASLQRRGIALQSPLWEKTRRGDQQAANVQQTVFNWIKWNTSKMFMEAPLLPSMSTRLWYSWNFGSDSCIASHHKHTKHKQIGTKKC